MTTKEREETLEQQDEVKAVDSAVKENTQEVNNDNKNLDDSDNNKTKPTIEQLFELIQNQYPNYSLEKYKKIKNLKNDAKEEDLIKNGCSPVEAKELFANKDKIISVHNQYESLHKLLDYSEQPAKKNTFKGREYLKAKDEEVKQFTSMLQEANPNKNADDIENLVKKTTKENFGVIEIFADEELRNELKKIGKDESNLKKFEKLIKNNSKFSDEWIEKNKECMESILKMLIEMIFPPAGLYMEAKDKNDNFITKLGGEIIANFTKSNIIETNEEFKNKKNFDKEQLKESKEEFKELFCEKKLQNVSPELKANEEYKKFLIKQAANILLVKTGVGLSKKNFMEKHSANSISPDSMQGKRNSLQQSTRL